MDIFIAYSSSDRAFANRLVDIFRKLGWSVFIDTTLSPGEAFTSKIAKHLSAARAVVVLWSETANVSDFVLDEATRAKEANKLVPVLIEAILPPLGFGQRHTLDLSNWNGEVDHEDFKALISSLERNLNGKPPESAAPTGEIVRHTLRGGSQGPEMIIAPAGQFLMGSARSDGRNSEKPQHRVTFAQPFMIGRYAVTVNEYRQFFRATGIKAHDVGNSPDHPAVNISWKDATAYCEWLSEETGKHYSLPSEAQWEYACRAGSPTAFAFGDSLQESDANFNQANGGTVAADSYEANDFGLQMHGNVWEWCEDTWHRNYQNAPVDGLAWLDQNSEARVLRGGSWIDPQDFCRSAYRNGSLQPGARNELIGFRLSCLALI